MDRFSGSKISVGEYASRAAIDVVSAVAVTAATYATAYVVLAHGDKIVESTKNAARKVTRRFKK